MFEPELPTRGPYKLAPEFRSKALLPGVAVGLLVLGMSAVLLVGSAYDLTERLGGPDGWSGDTWKLVLELLLGLLFCAVGAAVIGLPLKTVNRVVRLARTGSVLALDVLGTETQSTRHGPMITIRVRLPSDEETAFVYWAGTEDPWEAGENRVFALVSQDGRTAHLLQLGGYPLIA